MKITISLTDEDLQELQPLLERSSRNIIDYITSLIKLSIMAKKSNNHVVMLEDIGNRNDDDRF